MEFLEVSEILKALGEETRVKIFDILRGGTICACKILEGLKISQPTLSHHMKVLCGSGLVEAKKEWKNIYYSLNCEKLRALTAFLTDVRCINCASGVANERAE